jgi:S-adenosylmethionine hydrolase
VAAEGLAGWPVPPVGRDDAGALACEVLWVDRFGNAQLNASPADVAHLRGSVTVTANGDGRPARLVDAFGDLAEGELGLVTDSFGLLALAFNAAPAAATLGIAAGDPVGIAERQEG